MPTSPAQAAATEDPGAGPPAPLLAVSFLLAGLGTVLLGPLLPTLMQQWSLTDQRGGLLLLAKFFGAFAGGVSIPRRLRIGIFSGHLCAAAGLVGFAFSPGLPFAMAALLLSGFGLGQIIASTNILAGRRWSTRTGAALALINLFWSLGAVSTGILAATLLPRFGWRSPTLCLAGLLFAVGLAGPLARRPGTHAPASEHPPESVQAALARGTAIRFGLVLLLYGGLETCLTAWLTTYALRVGGHALLGGQSAFVLLWLALTAGRALASAALRRWEDRTVQRVSLLFCLLLVLALTRAHSPVQLSLCSILLGLALAPVFPSSYALALSFRPSPRVAGTILAVSGLGAALFPWCMGALSTLSGSLRIAMLVPALLIPAMVAATPAGSRRPA